MIGNAAYFIFFWSLAFGGASYYVHQTWPWGMIFIPFFVAYVWIHKNYDLRTNERMDDEKEKA